MRGQKYRRATEQIVLDRLANGTLRVDTARAIVWVRRRPRGRWRRLSGYGGGRTRAYVTIRLHQNGARRGVMLHRLVWIAHHRKLIPDGCEIHHKDHHSLNGIDYIECLAEADHRAITAGGYPAEWDDEDW